VEKKAQDLLLQARKGADFAQLAAKHSEDEAGRKKGGDLGEVKRGRKPAEWERAAFALTAGEVDLAMTGKGIFLIKVEEVKETERLPEVEAKALATRKLKEVKAKELAREAAGKAREEMLGGKAAEVAKKYNVALQETPLFAQGDPVPGLGQMTAFTDAALRLKPNDVSPVVNLTLGYAVLQGMERQPAGVQPFDQVKERVRQNLARQAARKEAEAEAQRLLGRLRQGEPLAQVAAQAGLAVQDSGFFTRQQGFLQQSLAEALTSAAFHLSAKQPFADKPLFWKDKYYLLAFRARRAPGPEEFAKEADKIREEFLQYKRQALFESWLADERRRAVIKISELPS
jgi:peptidyl-prolyl cis-trans isomerase D